MDTFSSFIQPAGRQMNYAYGVNHHRGLDQGIGCMQQVHCVLTRKDCFTESIAHTLRDSAVSWA